MAQEEVVVKEIDESEYNDKKLSVFTKVLIALVGVLVVALLTVFIIIPNLTITKALEVPDVSGLTKAAAREKLEKLGLKVSPTVKTEYTSEVEKGKISKTDPKAGSKVKKGATIVLYKSSGTDKIKIEDYTGQDVNQVKAKLELQGLGVIVEKKKVDNKDDYKGKEDNIVDQSVKDKELVLGDNIILYTPDMTEVYPDFTGYTKSQVEEFCKENGCVVTFEEQVDNSKTPGTVVSQSRAKGADVVEGATITIVITKLDEKKLVPVEQESTSNNSSSESSSEETSN